MIMTKSKTLQITEYKPKEIEIPYISVSYPVGSNMANLKIVIETYVNAFKTLEFADGFRFNLFCSGSSGAIISTAFALALPQYIFKICHVKKPGEDSHQYGVEYEPYAVNIVIDDFISTGVTVERIVTNILELRLKPHILIVCTGDCPVDKEFETIIRYKP